MEPMEENYSEEELRKRELDLIKQDLEMSYPGYPNVELVSMGLDTALTNEEMYLYGSSGHGLVTFPNYPVLSTFGLPLELLLEETNQRREAVNEGRTNFFLIRTSNDKALKVFIEYLPLSEEAMDNKHPGLTFKVVKAETITGDETDLPEDIYEQIMRKVEEAQAKAKEFLISGESLVDHLKGTVL